MVRIDIRRPAASRLIACLLLISCQASEARPPPAPSPSVVTVTMRDSRFVYQTPIRGGRVVFEVMNRDGIDHDMRLQSLTEDVPPIEEQLRGSKRRILAPYAGILVRRPGQRGTFAVDLVEGRRYAFLCYVKDDTGTAHALSGMASEFRAVAPTMTTVR